MGGASHRGDPLDAVSYAQGWATGKIRIKDKKTEKRAPSLPGIIVIPDPQAFKWPKSLMLSLWARVTSP